VAILTYLNVGPDDRRVINYSFRHPKEYRRLAALRENPELINPDDFPYAKLKGIIDERNRKIHL
jgi:hypothetical protein